MVGGCCGGGPESGRRCLYDERLTRVLFRDFGRSGEVAAGMYQSGLWCPVTWSACFAKDGCPLEWFAVPRFYWTASGFVSLVCALMLVG
jgi:hypothetical protein